jgi:hypothetical protein
MAPTLHLFLLALVLASVAGNANAKTRLSHSQVTERLVEIRSLGVDGAGWSQIDWMLLDDDEATFIYDWPDTEPRNAEAVVRLLEPQAVASFAASSASPAEVAGPNPLAGGELNVAGQTLPPSSGEHLDGAPPSSRVKSARDLAQEAFVGSPTARWGAKWSYLPGELLTIMPRKWNPLVRTSQITASVSGGICDFLRGISIGTAEQGVEVRSTCIFYPKYQQPILNAEIAPGTTIQGAISALLTSKRLKLITLLDVREGNHDGRRILVYRWFVKRAR